jgi:hypothetical protein
MIELVVLACLLREPGHCESHQLPMEPMGIVECMVTGQQHLASWLERHPGWRVRRWSCGFPRA